MHACDNYYTNKIYFNITKGNIYIYMLDIYTKVRYMISYTHQLLWVNQQVIKDLSWLAHHFTAGSSIFMLNTITWNARDADLILFTDTSSIALEI